MVEDESGEITMNMSFWIILFLIIFMLHNLEEIITVEKWLQDTFPRVHQRIPAMIQKELTKKQMTTRQFAVVVFILSIFGSCLLVIGEWTQKNYFFLGIALFFAINIVSHPLQSLFLRSYTPGVITSIFLIIPYYSMFFYEMYQHEVFSATSIVGIIMVIIFLLLAFILSHKLSEKWR